MGRRLPAVLLSLLAVWACSRPISTEQFIPASQAEGGVYPFAADFSDSLGRYDLYLYTKVDHNVWKFLDFDGTSLALEWESPSGRCYADTVFLQPSDVTHSTYFSQAIRVLYRSGVSPKEPGQWTIRLSLVGDDAYREGLRGFGLQIVRKDGTR